MEIKIDGMVDVGDVSHEEFWSKLMSFFNENNWCFGGSTKEYKDEEGEL